MITAFIFFVHLIFITVIFTYKWQRESLSSAFTNLALIILLFSVGWSVTGIIAKILLEQKGFGLYFDRDTFSLVVLTIAEYIFYYMYYDEKLIEVAGEEAATEAGTEK
ncbi:MAG: hypothetical protein WCJ01_12060 [Ignavibacteria bacterium]